MSKSKDFKEQYKQHPVRLKAIQSFNDTNAYSVKRNVRQFMCQVMATIGLELEDRFADIVTFDDNNFKLFGREKSLSSISAKQKHNIDAYNDKFLAALERNEELPTEVRPIFDFYAFKLVCPEIQDSQKIMNKVLEDLLDNINSKYGSRFEDIPALKQKIKKTPLEVVEYLDMHYSDTYPGLKYKIYSVVSEQEYSNKVQNFLDNTPTSVDNLTYSDYYSKIIECYQILLRLSYEESYEESERIIGSAKEARDKLAQLIENGQSDDLIDESNYDEYNEKLQGLIDHVTRKKTNKLDLSLSDLMIFDILNTSKELKRLGVKYSKDPTRTKQKRNPNGYIADFYSLDLPNGLMAEIQLQSYYRYIYGETGPAAHHKMGNGIKKRTLLPRPQEKSKYPEWAEAQFRSLPKFFAYRCKGYVEVFNTLKNFKQYYKCQDKSEVQTYVQYIASHDIDLLEGTLLSYSKGEPSRLDSMSDERDDDDFTL